MGAVYQGRFKAIAVQRDAHFLAVCRYVEQNPVRAGLASSAKAWPWGSAAGARSARGPDDLPLAGAAPRAVGIRPRNQPIFQESDDEIPADCAFGIAVREAGMAGRYRAHAGFVDARPRPPGRTLLGSDRQIAESENTPDPFLRLVV